MRLDEAILNQDVLEIHRALQPVRHAVFELQRLPVSPSNRVVSAITRCVPGAMEKGFHKEFKRSAWVDSFLYAVGGEGRQDGYDKLRVAVSMFGVDGADEVASRVNPTHGYAFERYELPIPDAFVIYQDTRVVVAFEVEDTNPMKPSAFHKYAWAYWYFDAMSPAWTIALATFDIMGNARYADLMEASLFLGNIESFHGKSLGRDNRVPHSVVWGSSP